MFDILMETFIYEYYLYFSLLGKFFESKKIFDILIEIFQLKNQDGLYDLLEGETIQNIKTEEDYKRYKRIEQYNQLTGSPKLLSSAEETIIALKGKAFTEAKKNQLYSFYNDPQSLVVNKIFEGIKKGNIIAMRIFGTMRCAGIFLDKNLEDGIKSLNAATRWGDFLSSLALLKFDSSNQISTLKILHSIVLNSPYQMFFSNLCNVYSLTTTEYNEKTLLLKRAFAMDMLDSKVYNPLASKLIFDSIIENKEIEKIIFSQDKDLIYELCELPIVLPKDNILIQNSSINCLSIKRKPEINALKSALKNSNFRAQKEYKPVGLYGGDEYILYAYTQYLVRALEKNHIVKIDVCNLTLKDLEWNKNSIFIRNIVEEKNTIFILEFKGKISASILEWFENFLKTEKRKHISFVCPPVSLDLSFSLPICICDKYNTEVLHSLLDWINVTGILEEEKDFIIYDILSKKEKLYSLKNVLIHNDAIKMLRKFTLSANERIIDQILKNQRQTSKKITITCEMLSSFTEHIHSFEGKPSFGFGGILNENN